MSKSHSNGKTILFVGTVALICSLMLSAAATVLKDRQEANVRLDMQKNILTALGMVAGSGAEPAAVYDGKLTQLPHGPGAAAVEALFAEGGHVQGIAVDGFGKVVTLPEGTTVADLIAEEEKLKAPAKMRLPVYVLFGESASEPLAYAVPIEGKGLWSTLYGFIALDGDLNTVKGITFYKHGETPGLGAEVTNPDWQAQWPGEKILNEEGELVSILVQKGGSNPDDPHAVDAISGATMTSDGVTHFLKADLALFEPYFNTIRKGN